MDSSAGADDVDQVVAIRHGGLASSSTEVRTWQMGTEQVHHIVDPATGRSSAPYWRLVSAAGASCVDANALSTAAWSGVTGRRALRALRTSQFGCCATTGRSSPSAVGPRTAVNSTYLWYATRASGIVALILLTLTMVLGLVTTSRARARNWPGFAQQEIHRRISIMAVVFLAIHVLTSILDTYVHIGWFAIVVPFTSPYSRFWVGLGTIALDLMVAVFVSSLLRAHLRPGTWRGIHWLAYASWPIALAHTFGLGTDSREHWVIALGALCVLSVGLALVWRLRAVGASDGPWSRPPPSRRSADPSRDDGQDDGDRDDA